VPCNWGDSLLKHYVLVGQCTPILIQQNVDGSNFFDRTWTEFKAGFGDPSGNYWLANEQLHQLTKDNQYKLHFDLLCNTTGQWYVAEYSTFTVASEADGYRLNVAGFSGNASYDALSYQNGMRFVTKDRNNWQCGIDNCAVHHGGGFWYKACGYCGVNAPSGNAFIWIRLPGGWPSYHLRSSRMWLMCR
jgi:hypothetical protein